MQASAPTGLKVIVGYKLAKATVELLISATFFGMGFAGSARKLAYLAMGIRHHVTEAWSISLAERLLDASTAHHVFVVAMALLADGILTIIEGWALSRRYAWARWLVVATTACLLPFEVRAIMRHPNVGHVGVLLANVLIVIYLAVRGGAEGPKADVVPHPNVGT